MDNAPHHPAGGIVATVDAHQPVRLTPVRITGPMPAAVPALLLNPLPEVGLLLGGERGNLTIGMGDFEGDTPLIALGHYRDALIAWFLGNGNKSVTTALDLEGKG